MSAALALSAGLLACEAVWLLLGIPASVMRMWTGRAAGMARRASLRVASLRVRLPKRARSVPEARLDEVAEMVDIVRLGMGAGLSFDAALDLYRVNRSSALASALSRAELSWRVGAMTREEALIRVARDMGVPALRSFASAVCRSLAFGAPVSSSLSELAREVRDLHRAEVERRIERAPVKILVPTGTLVLPALLLSILGPLLAAGGMI